MNRASGSATLRFRADGMPRDCRCESAACFVSVQHLFMTNKKTCEVCRAGSTTSDFPPVVCTVNNWRGITIRLNRCCNFISARTSVVFKDVNKKRLYTYGVWCTNMPCQWFCNTVLLKIVLCKRWCQHLLWLVYSVPTPAYAPMYSTLNIALFSSSAQHFASTGHIW